MSSSSSVSGPSSPGGGGTGLEVEDSPVRYRVGPLAYEPAVNCRCGLKACRWISWSIGQPGRRYYRCRRDRTREDCMFFRWVDEECSPWYKLLLGDLRDAVRALKRQVTGLEQEVAQKNIHLVDKQMQLEAKQKELDEKEMLVAVQQHELDAKQEEVDAKQEEVNAKQEELNAKLQELTAKQQHIDALELSVHAMKAKMKTQNQCIDGLVAICVVLVIILVFVLLTAKKP